MTGLLKMRCASRTVGQGNHAFSLVEVMVAILVLGIGLVGLTQGITAGLRSGKESETQTTAALLAAGRIEELRAEGGLTDSTMEGDSGEFYHWQQTIAPAGIDGLHKVDVVILNPQSGETVYELETLLFEPVETTATNANGSLSSSRRGQ
jgi:prepilin-type N-terminal cleavage/methylation domain-containing protein